MSEAWTAVDDYITGHLLGDDPALDAALVANTVARSPEIDVSAAKVKMLHLLARMAGARRILEIGTLGSYSTFRFPCYITPSSANEKIHNCSVDKH